MNDSPSEVSVNVPPTDDSDWLNITASDGWGPWATVKEGRELRVKGEYGIHFKRCNEYHNFLGYLWSPSVLTGLPTLPLTPPEKNAWSQREGDADSF